MTSILSCEPPAKVALFPLITDWTASIVRSCLCKSQVILQPSKYDFHVPHNRPESLLLSTSPPLVRWVYRRLVVEAECCALRIPLRFSLIIFSCRFTFTQQVCSFQHLSGTASHIYAAIRRPKWLPPQLPPRKASRSFQRPFLRFPCLTHTRKTLVCTESACWLHRIASYHRMQSQWSSRWNKNNPHYLNFQPI